MTAMLARGRCPSLFAPMRSGDGLLARVRPPGGILHADAARRLAAAATRYGNGVIELGSRASLQIRGLREETAAPFAREMIRRGLALADAEAERRRIVICSPLAGDDPTCEVEARSLIASIEQALALTTLSGLPDKFGILVDAGGVLPIGAAAADIRVIMAAGAAAILLDGSDAACITAPSDVAEIVSRLLRAFLGETAGSLPAISRMRGLVDRVGACAVFARAGVPPSSRMALPPVPNAIGWLSFAGGVRGAFGVGLPFGRAEATHLTKLADLTEDLGDATLRVTPWRALLIPSGSAPEVLRARLRTFDLVIDAADRRARVWACSGKSACASATVPARADAARLAALDIPGSLHVSGCAKGCAHPAIADVTLVGHAGRYDIVRDGRACDAPTAGNLTIDAVISALGRERPIC